MGDVRIHELVAEEVLPLLALYLVAHFSGKLPELLPIDPSPVLRPKRRQPEGVVTPMPEILHLVPDLRPEFQLFLAGGPRRRFNKSAGAGLPSPEAKRARRNADDAQIAQEVAPQTLDFAPGLKDHALHLDVQLLSGVVRLFSPRARCRPAFGA